MKQIEKKCDLSEEEIDIFFNHGYVCVDTETTGLSYISNKLCTIQLFCEDQSIIIRFDECLSYENLKKVFSSNNVLKIFHNAVFDVSFLMKNLKMNEFGKLVCTKIASKMVNGLEHNNSLKSLLKEYLSIEINKTEQLSDWSKSELSDSQKEYAVNDVKYLYNLWNVLYEKLKTEELDELAFKCFAFIPYYKKLTDIGIENVFVY